MRDLINPQGIKITAETGYFAYAIITIIVIANTILMTFSTNLNFCSFNSRAHHQRHRDPALRPKNPTIAELCSTLKFVLSGVTFDRESFLVQENGYRSFHESVVDHSWREIQMVKRKPDYWELVSRVQ